MSKEGYGLYKISRGNIKTIIRRAFLDGKDWATREPMMSKSFYISWFDPTKEDTEKKIKESTRKIMRIISKLKIKEEQ